MCFSFRVFVRNDINTHLNLCMSNVEPVSYFLRPFGTFANDFCTNSVSGSQESKCRHMGIQDAGECGLGRLGRARGRADNINFLDLLSNLTADEVFPSLPLFANTLDVESLGLILVNTRNLKCEIVPNTFEIALNSVELI